MPEMVKCPGCDLRLPVEHPWRQIAHMEVAHPEIIDARLRRAGFLETELHGEKCWFDLLADTDA